MADQTAQHALNDFLQLELLHSLGSYGVVAHFLRSLERRIQHHPDQKRFSTLFPGNAVSVTQAYNRLLRDDLHRPAHLRGDHSRFQEEADPDARTAHRPPRHPAPGQLGSVPKALRQWVVDFYATAVHALERAHEYRSDGEPPSDMHPERLGKRLMEIHDPSRRGIAASDPELFEGRTERMRMRLARAEACLGLKGRTTRSQAILEDQLEQRDGKRLHTAVIWAFVEAHLGMHDVEHLTSHSFGDQAEFRAQTAPLVAASLERSVVLNTFVYVAARIVPWVFAADDEERSYVVDRYQRCCDTITPTYCMWIAHQLSLLALQRRAYTWMLERRADKAYRDFYKLKRFARGLERTLDQRVSRARGADLFLDGLAALADHHTGRLYRLQHAYTTAVRHFERAARRLTSLEALGGVEEPVRNEPEPTAREAVRDSRWRVDLLMNQGKAHYECGHMKRSLLCYARAWRAFLDLAVSESMAVVANVDAVDSLVAWLERVQDDPDLDMVELARRVRPLVDQFGMVVGPTHLRLLSAEVMMRLGHLLYVLKLPAGPRGPGDGDLRVDHTLAYRCLLRAAWLDPWSTLTAGDILKIRRASRDEQSAVRLPEIAELHETEPKPPSVHLQWPAGGERFEEAARVIEYILQLWLDHDAPGEDELPAEDVRIARTLLDAFLAHTDSSNVKLAQVYRYLMQRGDRCKLAAAPSESPTLELVCMRRYSSFFPFLPRPSAFPVLGGGYFVRALEPGCEPFGIAIDPGPNFLENLYRCGYCIEDINMIVVTHDHADHVAALDALLALMRNRRLLGASIFSESKRLLILGNRGIVERYGYANRARPGDTQPRVKVLELGTEPLPPADVYGWPSTLRIRPFETVEHIDARDCLAQGFLVSVGDGSARSTALFTSDTGIPPSIRDGGEAASDSFAGLLDEANVVMAHLSSVPLPELRKLSGLERAPRTLKALQELKTIWNTTRRQAKDKGGDSEQAERQRFLLRQLQFGFHSLPGRSDRDKLGVTPFSPRTRFRDQPESHLYLAGLLAIARRMAGSERGKLLLVGELREELGAFRTRVAAALNDVLFARQPRLRALTADVGLKVRVRDGDVRVLCTTCDLDNDLVDRERFWTPGTIGEVCVKAEDEGVFYTCPLHDPRNQPRQTWIERVERYDPFGP